MKTKPLYETLLPWLPQEYQGAMKELEHRVRTSSKKAGDFVLLNPASIGLTQTEMLAWIQAMVSLTFKQHYDDGTLKVMGAYEETFTGLYKVADNIIAHFVAQYKNERHAEMSSTNFVNEFVSISSRLLSDLNQETFSFCLEQHLADNVQMTNAIFELDDWLTIKEFNPQIFDEFSKTTAKASYWKQHGDLRIIPISVAQDVLMLNSLVAQFEEAGKDLLKAIDQEMPEKICNDRDSICNEILLYIFARALKYKFEFEKERLTHLRFASTEIASMFTKSPDDMIKMYGPDILCVSWSE